MDGRNPANQLRLVVYPIIYSVLYIPGGCLGFLPSTVQQQILASTKVYLLSKSIPLNQPPEARVLYPNKSSCFIGVLRKKTCTGLQAIMPPCMRPVHWSGRYCLMGEAIGRASNHTPSLSGQLRCFQEFQRYLLGDFWSLKSLVQF